MVNIKNDGNGNIILEGEQFDLKIDANRIIYVKNKGDFTFKNTDSVVEIGYSSKEKEKFLYNLYQMINQRKDELQKVKEKSS